MASREDFLKLVWKDVIDPHLDEGWMSRVVEQARKDPDAPFAEAGLALKRLLDMGASSRDLALVSRQCSYESVFQLLYMLDDPGVDDGDVTMLQEELLGSDPSGTEGRRAPKARSRRSR